MASMIAISAISCLLEILVVNFTDYMHDYCTTDEDSRVSKRWVLKNLKK